MTRKTFPTLHVASCLTGIAFVEGLKYQDLQAVAAHLLGDDVYTHELGHRPTMDAVAEEGYRQFPDMPTSKEARADWSAAAVKALAAYGRTVNVQRGKHGRREHPVDTLKAMLPKEKRDRIIAIQLDEGHGRKEE